MKLNLIRKDSEKITGGYINIDPYAIPNSDVVACHHYNLTTLVDNGECQEIRALDVIDFVKSGNVLTTVQHWASKLKKGGTLCVGGSDIREIARNIFHGTMNEERANEYLYNVNDSPWDIKQSAGSLELMVNVFEKIGLKIQSKTIKKNRYIVTGIRE